MELKRNSFNAIVLKDKDLNNQGRYKVQIPMLMNLIVDTDGIMVKNQIHKWRCTDSDVGEYGEYKPLHPGTKVIVKFHANDINTGYIDRIISDQKMNSLPFKNTADRDDIYQLLRTPKYNNFIVVMEETENQPPNSMHFYFNKYRITLIVDEQGIHIHTDDNKDEEIDKSENLLVKQNRKRTVNKDEEILIKGNRKLQINGSYDIKINAKCNIETASDCNIKAAGNINFDGALVSINCGIAASATGNDGSVIPTYRNSKLKSDDNNTSRVVIEEE